MGGWHLIFKTHNIGLVVSFLLCVCFYNKQRQFHNFINILVVVYFDICVYTHTNTHVYNIYYFQILSHERLLQDIEYSSLRYAVGPYLFILYKLVCIF